MVEVDIRVAVQSLAWGNPKGDAFVRWLDEVVEGGYEGISCFARDMIGFHDHPAVLRDLLETRNLGLAALTGFVSDDLETMEQNMRFMAALGAKHLACTDFDTELTRRQGADKLNEAGKRSKQYGVNVYYHNHDGGIAGSLTELNELMGMLDFNEVHLMLDVGHATQDFVELPAAERAITFLRNHWDRIEYLEFKDYNDITKLNTPVGEGLADYPAIFELIKTRGYHTWITVEQNGHTGWSLGRSPLETAKISREYIRRGLGV